MDEEECCILYASNKMYSAVWAFKQFDQGFVNMQT